MKTHIVFDTDDPEGMAATIKIVDKLAYAKNFADRVFGDEII
jgi:hypothetical protein